eukprot:5590640-Prymnesium_polylepis.3
MAHEAGEQRDLLGALAFDLPPRLAASRHQRAVRGQQRVQVKLQLIPIPCGDEALVGEQRHLAQQPANHVLEGGHAGVAHAGSLLRELLRLHLLDIDAGLTLRALDEERVPLAQVLGIGSRAVHLGGHSAPAHQLVGRHRLALGCQLDGEREGKVLLLPRQDLHAWAPLISEEHR